jgi:dolichyl-diphosphooligosaccharide--protein glycosyltransferase
MPAGAPQSPAPSSIPRLHLLALAAACLAGLAVRTVFRWSVVFRPDGVIFATNDAWHHARFIDHLVHNFPHRMTFDPYGAFPGGMIAASGPLFDYLIAALAWAAGRGAPATALTETVAAWFPAVLGALIPLPVYLVGRRLFSGAAGLVAAALVAVLPGHYLLNSSLGVTDHHVLETLLYVLLLLTFVPALDAAATASPRERVRHVLLCGLVLAAYLATWVAGAAFVAILTGWTVAACLLRHWRGRSSADLAGVVAPAFGLALLLFLPAGGVLWSQYTLLALAVGLASILLVAGLSSWSRSRGLPRWALFAALGVAAAASIALVLRLAPGLAAVGRSLVARLNPASRWMTVAELRPLLQDTLSGTLSAIWHQFTLSGFLAAVALGWLAVPPRAGSPGSRKTTPGFGLFLAWSAVLMFASLLQTRICYYAVVSVALLAGYLVWELIRGRKPIPRALLAAAVFAGVLVPNAWPIRNVNRWTGGPSRDWTLTLDWLRTATPEPFGDPAWFHRRYVSSAGQYSAPASAYGIMNWWDEGYWIIYRGRRIPVANPTQHGATTAARFYLAQDEAAAATVLRECGARYVLADPLLLLLLDAPPETDPVSIGRIPAMAQWAGTNPYAYAEIIFQEVVEGVREPLVVYYPEFYRTMAVRLYAFDGQAVTPRNSTWVIATKERKAGRRIHQDLRFAKPFDSYEAAAQYLEQHKKEDPGLRIAGLDPRRSCVPLEPLRGFRLEFASRPVPVAQQTVIETVKVFSHVHGAAQSNRRCTNSRTVSALRW